MQNISVSKQGGKTIAYVYLASVVACRFDRPGRGKKAAGADPATIVFLNRFFVVVFARNAADLPPEILLAERI